MNGTADMAPPDEPGLVVDPSDPETVRSARSFGAAASVYHRARPGYPVEAIAWLVGDAVRVLDRHREAH